MMAAPAPEPFTAPCGCRLETIDETFVVTACDAGADCPTVQYVQAESERQGKLTTSLDLS